MAKQESVATQQFVDIEEIKNGTVILKNHGLRRVLMVSGVNFELKSEEEQNIIISTYQNFLNGLDFSVQILIHSRKMNIDSYLNKLIGLRENEPNELIKNQISEYSEFIKSFVEMNAVMTKTFLVIVPYDAVQISGAGESLLASLKFWEKSNNIKKKDEGFEQRINQLNQRVDQVTSGLSQIGLRVVALNDEELVELFYNLYNPATTERKDIKIAEDIQ